ACHRSSLSPTIEAFQRTLGAQIFIDRSLHRMRVSCYGRAEEANMMRARFFIIAALLLATSAYAADQTRTGEGNAHAIAIASKSPAVASAFAMLKSRAAKVRNVHAREATLDAIANPDTCVAHRAGLDAAAKSAIVHQLLEAGLLDSSDG